jgi:hypothetical protein
VNHPTIGISQQVNRPWPFHQEGQYGFNEPFATIPGMTYFQMILVLK